MFTDVTPGMMGWASGVMLSEGSVRVSVEVGLYEVL